MKRKSWKSFFPFLQWQLNTSNLKADFIAGITVTLLLVPQSMAYAELAGLPAYYGLYASFVPVFLSALFGRLGQLASGPTALTAIVTASVLMPFVVGLEGKAYEIKYVQLAILLAVVVGILRLIIGIFRMGTMVNFISHPVIIGFTNGGALVICISQFPKLFGIPGAREPNIGFGGFISDFAIMISNVSSINWMTFAFGTGSLLSLILLKKYAKKLPGAIIVVLASVVLAKALDYHEVYASPIVGDIPSGIPGFSLPGWSFPGSESQSMLMTAFKMIPAALMVTLIGFMEVLAISKAVSMKTRQPMDLNQELLAQGVAAVGGSFFQAYPTSVSFSRSALSLEGGAKTAMCQIFSGIGVLLVLSFFTEYLYYLPKSTLAALIAMSVYNLINFNPIKLAWKANKSDGLAAAITLFVTVFFAPQIVYGIVIGAGLTLGMYMYRTMKPDVKIYGIDTEQGLIMDSNTAALAKSDHIAALRFRGSLFFASMANFEEKVLEAIGYHPKAKFVVVAAEGINRIDASGEWGLRQLLRTLGENGITLVFAGLPKSSLETLERTGLDDEIGQNNFYTDLPRAIREIHAQLSPVEDYMI